MVLSVLLLSVACCNGKKLWGVDVGKKEEVCALDYIHTTKRRKAPTIPISPVLRGRVEGSRYVRMQARQRTASDTAAAAKDRVRLLLVALAKLISKGCGLNNGGEASKVTLFGVEDIPPLRENQHRPAR